MRTIYKYRLEFISDQRIALPIDAQILKIAEQDDSIQLWAMQGTETTQYENREIRMVGTGFTFGGDNMLYLDTVLSRSGLVWHFFELLNSEDDA